jgi:hypothetical protein
MFKFLKRLWFKKKPVKQITVVSEFVLIHNTGNYKITVNGSDPKVVAFISNSIKDKFEMKPKKPISAEEYNKLYEINRGFSDMIDDFGKAFK